MAMILKVTPETLQSQATEMTTAIEAINASLKVISDTVFYTQRYWQGDAEDKHISNFEEVEPPIVALMKDFATAPVDLLKIAGLYEETESANVQAAAALPDDIF